MTGPKEKDKNLQNAPKLSFSPICDLLRFDFKNQALSLLYTYDGLTSCKKRQSVHWTT